MSKGERIMKRNTILIGVILLLLLLSACSKDKYEPFTPLSKVTVSPEREAAVQAALNGGTVPQQPKPTEAAPVEGTEDLPTFDENSFFAEVDAPSGKQLPTEEVPFEPEPTEVPPTPIPEPTATKPYDPNIMMYGTNEKGLTTYTLQEGEDLVCIGRRFNVSVNFLLAQNGLTSPDEAPAGTVIVLPENPEIWKMTDGYGRRTLVLHPATYTTEEGDNLFSIACKYGDVRPEDLAVKNTLVLGEPLREGMQITVP